MSADLSADKNPIKKKLQKILNPKFLSDKETQDALTALSEFFTDNNVRSRRKLRGDTELRSLRLNEQFLSELETLNKELVALEEEVYGIHTCYQEMRTLFNETREKCSEVLEETAAMQKEAEQIDKRTELLLAFEERFQLSDEEIDILSQSDKMTPVFFSSLQKVKQIHTECAILIRSSDQRAGLEIMDNMAKLLEKGFENLFYWSQHTCRSFTGEFPIFTQEIILALSITSERLVLRNYILNEYTTTRRSTLVRALIDSLTLGGPCGSSKPIEMHSHDPVRYVSDLLGWLHQAMVCEKELLQSLLEKSPDILEDTILNLVADPKIVTEDSALSDNNVEVYSRKHLLNKICEGVSQMIKVRIEQILSNIIDSMDLFKVSNNIRFYMSTYERNIGSESDLVRLIGDIYELSLKLFAKHLNTHAAKLLESVSEPPFDLEPTIQFTETLTLLRSILSLENSSVAPLECNQSLLNTIYVSLVTPILEYSTISASLDTTLSPVELLIYLLNCYYRVHQCVSLYFSSEHSTSLQELLNQMTSYQERLSREQAHYFLSRAGLQSVYQDYHSSRKEHRGPLSDYPGLESHTISAGIRNFNAHLALPDQHPLPQLDYLRSKKIRDYVLNSAMKMVCEFYTSIYTEIIDKDNNYGNVISEIHEPQEISRLLL